LRAAREEGSRQLPKPAGTVKPSQMNKHLPVMLALGVFMILNGSTTARAQDDFQTWQTVSLKWLDTKYVDLTTTAHTRFTDDSSDFSLWRIGQAASVDPLSWLRAGVAYRYTEARPPAGDWRHQHRGEFQLTPHFKLSDRVSVSLRNRLELRDTEGADELHEVFRTRLQFNITTPEWKPVRGFYVSDEIFHSFDRSEVFENRVVPLGLRFRLHEKADWRVFYMIRSVRGGDEWRHDHILGTGLSFRL
jgi:hypothetical protein